MKKQLYKSNIHSNFSIGDDVFYLTPGVEISLPEHELTESLLISGSIEKVEVKVEKSKKV